MLNMNARDLVSNNVYANMNHIIDLLDPAMEKITETLEQRPRNREDDDDEYDDILEVYLVSSWFGKKLAEKGENVWILSLGENLWGRRTSGQAIWLDGVVQEIADEVCK